MEQSLNNCDIKSSIDAVCDGRSIVPIEQVPKFLFQLDTQRVFETQEDSEGDFVSKEQKLQKKLKELLETQETLEVLRGESACLHEPLERVEGSCSWLRDILANTLAAALQQTLCVLLPNVDERSINADVDFGVGQDERLSVWLSEVESGGMGVVTQLHD